MYIPYITTSKGVKIVDKVSVMKRLEEINDDLMSIAERRGNPLWLPSAGNIGFRAWELFNEHGLLPYPGTYMQQPKWFWDDVAGFNDMEAWVYLKHEQATLCRSAHIMILDADLVYLND